jgi:hypothetical protein
MGALLPFLKSIAPYLASALGLAILGRLRTPRDHERAALLVTIADAVAASLASKYPTADWAVLLQQVESEISAALGGKGFPVVAIQREAIRALTAIGRAPAVPAK